LRIGDREVRAIENIQNYFFKAFLRCKTILGEDIDNPLRYFLTIEKLNSFLPKGIENRTFYLLRGHKLNGSEKLFQ